MSTTSPLEAVFDNNTRPDLYIENLALLTEEAEHGIVGSFAIHADESGLHVAEAELFRPPEDMPVAERCVGALALQKPYFDDPDLVMLVHSHPEEPGREPLRPQASDIDRQLLTEVKTPGVLHGIMKRARYDPNLIEPPMEVSAPEILLISPSRSVEATVFYTRKLNTYRSAPRGALQQLLD